MALNLPNASQQAATDGVVDRLDPAGSKVRLYTGTQPGDADSEPAGQICELPMDTPAFGPADTDGIATAGPITSAATTAAGVVASFACLTSANAVVFNGNVGLVSSGADLELTSVDLADGETVNINNMTFTTPQTQT